MKYEEHQCSYANAVWHCQWCSFSCILCISLIFFYLPPDDAIQKAFAWLAVATLAGSAFPGQSCPLLFPEFYGDPVGPISPALACPSGWESSGVLQICCHLQSWCTCCPPACPAGHWERLNDLSHHKTTVAHFLPGSTVQTWTQAHCGIKCWPALAKSS